MKAKRCCVCGKPTVHRKFCTPHGVACSKECNLAHRVEAALVREEIYIDIEAVDHASRFMRDIAAQISKAVDESIIVSLERDAIVLTQAEKVDDTSTG